MSENIPEDIMAAANECVAQFRWNNDNRWHLFVARAILAERQRCTEKAMHWATRIAEEDDGEALDVKIAGMIRKLHAIRSAFNMKGANATTILRVINTLSVMQRRAAPTPPGIRETTE